MTRRVLIVVLSALVLGGIVFFGRNSAQAPTNGVSNPEEETGTSTETINELFTVFAENLEIPWDITPIAQPDEGFLVTERPGRLTGIYTDGTKQTIEVPMVHHTGEGGLLGIALHPQFSENRYVYLYQTEHTGHEIVNNVSRYVFENNTLSDRTVLVEGIPGASYHDGGQLAFGPDGYLYITTGDAGNPEDAQSLGSLSGKILRITDDGQIPDDNPFGTIIWSYGHRNPQGLAWDNEGRLWSTEHGRSGIRSGFDELNLIEKGGNYGWPDSQGDTVQADTIAPVLHSGSNTTWAPASAAYLNGSIYFGGLRGETLYEAVLDGSGGVEGLREHFTGEFGRIRAVVASPLFDELYITTSNRDGRGDVNTGDDKLIRINPELLE